MRNWQDVPCRIGGSRQARAIWTRMYGNPGDLWVLHRCHEEWCWEPRHFYLGTAVDNYRDMAERWGDLLPQAKIMGKGGGWIPRAAVVKGVRTFIEEECVEHPNVEAPSAALYNLYIAWYSARGDRWPISNGMFGRCLGFLGYKRRKANSMTRWVGIYHKSWPQPSFTLSIGRTAG